MTRIALDAMGGDKAPGEMVRGGIVAATDMKDVKVFLVGRRDLIDTASTGASSISATSGAWTISSRPSTRAALSFAPKDGSNLLHASSIRSLDTYVGSYSRGSEACDSDGSSHPIASASASAPGCRRKHGLPSRMACSVRDYGERIFPCRAEQDYAVGRPSFHWH